MTSEQILASLLFIQGELQKLRDNNQIRYEANAVFQAARQELDTVILTYQAPPPVVAPVIQVLMTDEQVTDLIASVRTDIEESDLAVLDAITASKDEVLAALPA